MSRDLKNLELEVDRDMRLLSPRLEVDPPISRRRIDSIVRAMVDESVRIRGARRRLGIRAVGFGAAAAVLLAFAFGALERSKDAMPTGEPTLAEADQWVNDWMSAAAVSSDRLSVVVHRTWTSDELISDPADEDAVESFLESFERIENMTGAS